MVKIGNLELSEEEISEFRQVFDLVDTDKRGTIEAPEVKKLLNLLRLHPSPQEVAKMIKEVDKSGNGQVAFEEFVQIMAGKQQTNYSKKDTMRAFRFFQESTAPHGLIHPESIERALLTYCSHKVSKDEATQLVAHLKTSAEGFVDFKEQVDTSLFDAREEKRRRP
mmetsp:Transcript_15045/g.25477  ORF Transcript_15045/g.25477 Transcript_15045/m.25477 type:complete len:166 (-) Transcript_15045:14-511(-)|eukprot:CAMPEP_0198213220 /NCGR_PEP_ID=MMETSP1445-20131203/28746_1 /TAXON_ID=36898 /ORGANISM="Pyramimonas sp., Strain CCMP2087" /LENGTH=165 /DNA_ID=CAMNT_0043887837 /DNA_START=142 /DNA_END=639 /DNA_ORIENTATION=+